MACGGNIELAVRQKVKPIFGEKRTQFNQKVLLTITSVQI